MSNWNHRMCGDCWIWKHLVTTPEGTQFRVPVMTDAPPSLCCVCGNKTKLGIFVRIDPKVLQCTHEEE